MPAAEAKGLTHPNTDFSMASVIDMLVAKNLRHQHTHGSTP
jgi:hypothetical protein